MSRAARRISVAAAAVLATVGTAAAAAGPPDVVVRVLPSATDTWVGRPVVFNVTMSDLGGADAAGVAVTIEVAGTSDAKVIALDEDLADCSNPGPAQVTCAIALLAHGQTARARLQLQPSLPGTLQVSAHATANGDTKTENDEATASTAVHPGRQGPPQLRASGRVNGAFVDAKDPRVAQVRGRFDVSEPGRISVQVVDRAAAFVLPVLAGSSIGSTKSTVRRTTVTLPVGTPRTTAMTDVPYDIRLPLARLREGRVYTIVVDAVDLEGEKATPLGVAFRLHLNP